MLYSVHMKIISSAVGLVSLLLSGCNVLGGVAISASASGSEFTPVSLSDAKQVPSDRLLAYQENIPEYRLLIVTRDKGFQGGGCFVGLEINGVLSGRFDPEESARFYIPSSEPAMRVVPDPFASGLCSLGGWPPAEQRYVLSASSENIFRITRGSRGRFILLPSSR
ncbi:MAG: hypothetical protein HZC23_14110 [Rhodocyclales bacterium]|nr:hypothetical protein [Rhodocyclales bacterium]